MTVDWDINIPLMIGATIGWILGTQAETPWYWFPVFALGFLGVCILYDVAKAGIRHVRSR